MFSKQERRKNKYKFDETKVCKAEEVRKYFVNPKIERFWLVCKFIVWISDIQTQWYMLQSMFFRTGALKNFAMLEFLFNKVAGLQTCNFINKKLHHRCFSVKFAKSLRASFLQSTSGGCFWKYLMNSLFIAYENDESCHSVVSTYWLSRTYFIYCACFVSFYFFHLFLFFCGFYHMLRHWGKFVNT